MQQISQKVKVEIELLSVLKLLGFFAGLYALYLVREVVALLFVAAVLASLIDPFARQLEARKMKRGIAVLIIYACAITLLSLLLVGILPPIVSEFGQLLANFGAAWEGLITRFASVEAVARLTGAVNIGGALAALQATVGSAAPSVFTSVFGGLAGFVVVLALTFYMVVEDVAVRGFFSSITPVKYHPYFAEILPRVQLKMGAWLRGQLILSACIFVAVFVALRILGVNYALVLALFSGVAEFVPYVGPVVSAVPAVILGFAQSPLHGVAVVVMYVVIQWIENHILVPKVMQRAVGINPIVSIVAILTGAKVGGFVGAVLAIPVATALTVFVQDFFARQHREHEVQV